MSRHVILLAGDPERREFLANATTTPGMLLGRASATQVGPSTAAAGTEVQKWFADLNPYVDAAANPTTANIDITYASGDTVRVLACDAGDRVNAFLAAGASVSAGAALESDGAGALQAHTTGRIVAFADETVDNSGGGSAVRIAVEVA